MYKSPVVIRLDHIELQGDLVIPDDVAGLVIFSHGSGSSRLSPRNRMVAEHLWKHRFATLLFDLLTEAEDLNHRNRFNIELLTGRLAAVTRWAEAQKNLKNLPVGYFGASTGAASALCAAAALGDDIKAVVSRGGRPDLAMKHLALVSAPTLLIVGGRDTEVAELNREALVRIPAEKQLEIISGATHLFEEPGKLEEVADLAEEWYRKHLIT
ncbi:MAG: dienelactone hydrolase family protein [Thermoanaerobaculia bacterium]|nr:dienelactone hydrolase family protein [Thermoanaerobaculia bacterium]